MLRTNCLQIGEYLHPSQLFLGYCHDAPNSALRSFLTDDGMKAIFLVCANISERDEKRNLDPNINMNDLNLS